MSTHISVELLIVSVFAAHILYVAIAYVLLRATKKTRIELSELTRELNERTDITDDRKLGILAMHDSVFSLKLLMSFLLGLIWGAIRSGHIKKK